MNVTTDQQQMCIATNLDRMVSASKNRPVLPFTGVKSARVAATQILHGLGDRAAAVLHKNVKVIAHQAIGVNGHQVAAGSVRQQFKKDDPVQRVAEHRTVSRTPVHDMMPCAIKVVTLWSGHVGTALCAGRRTCCLGPAHKLRT